MSARRKKMRLVSITTEFSMLLEEDATSFSPELLSSVVPSDTLQGEWPNNYKLCKPQITPH